MMPLIFAKKKSSFTIISFFERALRVSISFNSSGLIDLLTCLLVIWLLFWVMSYPPEQNKKKINTSKACVFFLALISKFTEKFPLILNQPTNQKL